MILPPGCDYVQLGQREKQAVIAVGRNPNRMERDVDEYGRPTNVEYVEYVEEEDLEDDLE